DIAGVATYHGFAAAIIVADDTSRCLCGSNAMDPKATYRRCPYSRSVATRCHIDHRSIARSVCLKYDVIISIIENRYACRDAVVAGCRQTGPRIAVCIYTGPISRGIAIYSQAVGRGPIYPPTGPILRTPHTDASSPRAVVDPSPSCGTSPWRR